MDISHADLLTKGERFTLTEGRHTRDLARLSFERSKNEYFYPLFLKTDSYCLPEQFTIRTEIE